MLLLQAHPRRILMRIPMQATARTHRPPLIRPIAPYEALRDGRDVHLMPRIPNHPALFRERVERMPRDEPCCFDLVFFEELEEATDANGSGKEAFCLRSAKRGIRDDDGPNLERCRWWSLRRHMSPASRLPRQCRQRCSRAHLRRSAAIDCD